MILRRFILCYLLVFIGAADLSAANVVTNPGFEGGSINNGWTTWGSTISKSSEQKRSGGYSCLNTARTADWQGCVQDLNGKITVGTTYRISAWLRMRTSGAERGMILIQRTDASGVHYFNSEDPLVANDAWTPLVFYYTHNGTNITGVNLYMIAAGTTNDFFVDDVTVEAVYDAQAVGVDLSVTNGAATQRGSGFLFGLSATDPATSYYEPLKPKLQRDRPALNGAANWGPNTGFSSPAFMNRVTQAGAKHQVLISDAYCWERNYQNSWGWPGDSAHDGKGPYDLLDQTIDELLTAARTNGYQVEWDLWNEPDHPIFWGRGQAQFFATWKHAYQRVRSNDVNAVIVGPSVTGYDRYTGGAYLKSFLLYAQSNNVLPDVVSWHELSGSKSLNADVQAVRAFMASNGMPARPIDINEYIGDTEWSNPGIHAWYLAGLERAGVRRAAHAVWDEVSGDSSSGGIFAGRLAHLLTRDTHQPRAVWHVYKAYAELAGNLVPVSPGIQIDGVAATDTDGTVRIILGNDAAETNSVNLTINRLDLLPYYNSTGAVRVIVWRIPNTGTAALFAPVTLTNALITLITNSLPLPLTFGPAEVVLVTVQDPNNSLIPATWNANAEFSVACATNVNGVWSYGWANSANNTVGTMTGFDPNGYGQTSLSTWYNPSTGTGLPSVLKNHHSTATYYGFAPGKLGMHPYVSPAADHSVIWWQAPDNGVYLFNASWKLVGAPGGDGVRVSVHRNLTGSLPGSLLWSGYATYAAPTVSWNGNYSLTNGETLAFVVGNGTNNNYGADSTTLDLTVTTVSPLPRLDWVRSGNGMTLSWPLTTPPNYVLESASQLNPAVWTSVAGVTNKRVTLPLAEPQKYFRLNWH